MPTPAPPEWTLNAKHTHGQFGHLLVGCHIKKNADNTAYLFCRHDGSQLASSPGASLPKTAFQFTPDFDYNGLTGVSITMNTPVAPGKNWTGIWSSKGSPPEGIPMPTGPQSGDFTAQAGSGLGEDEAASSAKA
jgi:hypothetical protein